MRSCTLSRAAAVLVVTVATIPAVAMPAPSPRDAATVTPSPVARRADSIVAGPARSSSFPSVPLPVRRSPGAPVAARSPQAPSFLGYELGEERRYALGPLEALYGGEQAIWSIRLRELLGDPPDGIFELSHQWQRGATNDRQLPIGTLIAIDSEGELRVNGHGFPLEVYFKTERQLAGWGEENYTVRYRFEEKRFVKHIVIDGEDLEHVVQILGGDDLDLSVPTGLYAWAPATLNCSITLPLSPWRAAGFAPPRLTPGSSPSPAPAARPTRYADNSACREGLFANPGLISLMLPALWEEGTGEHDYVLLTPAGPFGMPGVSGGVGLTGRATGGGSGVNIAGGSRFDHQAAVNPRTNSRTDTMRYVERVPVEVGERTRDAWRFEGLQALEAVYVDDDGVVLRVDLDPLSWFGMALTSTIAGFDPQQLEEGRRELFVRLLWPSEY